jgi:hypothetical protein
MVIAAVPDVRDGSRGDADCAAGQGTGEHPTPGIGQVGMVDADDSANGCAVDFVQRAGLMAARRSEMESRIGDGIDLSAEVLSAPEQDLDGGAVLQPFTLSQPRLLRAGS